MKKLLYILLLLPLFVACSSDDDNGGSNTQDYTSFVVTFDLKSENTILSNCIAGYKKDGYFFKIANLGNFKKGTVSDEIKLNNRDIKQIYLFSDYLGGIRFDAVYDLKENSKNIITVANNTKGVEVKDKTDSTQYPQ